MVAIINGTRLFQKPDLTVKRGTDPNTKLKVINDALLITEKKKAEPPPQIKIATYKVQNLKKGARKAQVATLLAKQKKADFNEVDRITKSRVARVKNISLRNSRFNVEAGKGGIISARA